MLFGSAVRSIFVHLSLLYNLHEYHAHAYSSLSHTGTVPRISAISVYDVAVSAVAAAVVIVLWNKN